MIDGDWPGKAQDPPFFDRLLALQDKLNVPIFLAVERTIDGTSGGPLGLTRWDGMAVATQGEDSGPEGHTLAAPFWYVPHDYPKPLPNLSVAVAQAYLGKGHVKQPPFFLRPLVEAIDISRPTDVATLQKGSWYGRAFLNYSKLRQLARECLRVDAEHVFVPNESVQDKMVIVGFANRKHTTDTFHAPWSPDEAGVMFHAVAAYTLAVEPVYELRPNVRVALDIVFSFAAFLTLTWTLRSKSDAPDDAPVQRDQRIILIAVVAVLLFGLSLTKWASILWLDFFVVALSLVVHPFIAGIAERWHARRSHPSVPRKDPS